MCIRDREDTRQSLKLLNHFEIKKPLFSYHQHNEQGKSEQIINKLEDGISIASVSYTHLDVYKRQVLEG